MDRVTDFRRDAPVLAAAIRGVVVSLGMTLCLTAVASGGEPDVAAKLVPDVTAVPSAPPLQSTIDPTAAPSCAGALCGLEQSWKRGILPPAFKASGANDFKVENASGVILGRARAAETERLYEPAPLKLDYKFLGMKCEIGTFTVGSSQEGGTRCLF
jgi:hypothetical protein